MGNSVVTKYAFGPAPQPTYTNKMPNVWIPKSEPRAGSSIPAFLTSCCARPHPITILFSHGNAEDIGRVCYWTKQMAQMLSIDTICYDYTGYGLNKGMCTEADCCDDVVAVWDYLVNVRKVPSKRIIIMGSSIGTGPSTYLAHKLSQDGVQFGGLILQSPFTSCVRIVSDALSYVPYTDMFLNLEKIGEVNQPVMLIHGKDDDVVPYDHSIALWNKLSQAQRWRFVSITGANHNNIETEFYNVLMGNMAEFIESTSKS